MRPQGLKLDGYAIRKARQSKGLSVQGLADGIRITKRSMHRIESTGVTSEKNANKLCELLELSLDELKLGERDDIWFVSEGEGHGSIDVSLLRFWMDFSALVDRWHGLEEPFEISVTDTPKKKVIEVTNFGQRLRSWTLRPAEITDSGIIWRSLRGFRRYFWEEDLERLKYCHATQVQINDEWVMPKEAKPQYSVEFLQVHYVGENRQSKFEKQGERLFECDAAFRNSLQDWLEEARAARHFISTNAGMSESRLGIYRKDLWTPNSEVVLRIGRVYLADDGKIHRAPWPRTAQKSLQDSIEERGSLPIMGYHDGPDVPMCPDAELIAMNSLITPKQEKSNVESTSTT